MVAETPIGDETSRVSAALNGGSAVGVHSPPEEGPEGQEIAESIQQQMALVEPILDGLFKAAAEGDDYWLKGKSTTLLADWIIATMNIGAVMQQQIEAMGHALQAQEKQLEETRPAKGRMWVPGLD
jgi:hypothetical protein